MLKEEIKKIKKLKRLKKNKNQLILTFEIYNFCHKSKINLIKSKP
jgi:hypothetical protein